MYDTKGSLLPLVEGEVVEVNDRVAQDPNFINIDPYGEAWIVKYEVYVRWEHRTDTSYFSCPSGAPPVPMRTSYGGSSRLSTASNTRSST